MYNKNIKLESDVDTDEHLGNLEEIEITELDNNDDLQEVNIKLTNDKDSIVLKKPNEVYYELYKQARIEAKLLRKKAIYAHLAAENIKNKHSLIIEYDSDDNDENNENEDEDELYI